MFPLFSVVRYRLFFAVSILSVFSFGSQFVHPVYAQGSATNDLGNGGIHTVKGRIYISNGRRSDVTGLKIRLVNLASNELSVIADGNGTFTFRNLLPGSYTVLVEGGDAFESVRESVTIDDPGSSVLGRTVRLRGGAKIANVQIYMKPKAGDSVVGADVISAKLASIPKPAVEQYEAAQKSINEKNESKAIAELRSALAIHKEFSLAWNDLGVLLQNAGDSKGAVEAFRSAVKYDPESAAANLNLGCALFNEKAYKEAENHLMHSLVKNPSSYRGHYYMGLTQLKLERPDIAEQAFRTAIKVGNEQSGMAHYMLGGLYWSVKRYKDAADELEKYLRYEPNAKDADRIKATIAELKGKN